MDTDVWILGSYQSDFARNLTKEGLDFADLTSEVVEAALATANVDAAEPSASSTSRMRSARCSPNRATSAPCRPRCATVCGTPRRRGTKPLALPAVWRPWQRWPTCGRATTTPHWSSASSWRRPSPATPQPVISAPQRGPAMKEPTHGSSGHRCSPKSPTSTTAVTAWTTPICGRSRNSTSPTRGETPTRRPENGLCPTRSATTTRQTRRSRAGCADSTAAR